MPQAIASTQAPRYWCQEKTKDCLCQKSVFIVFLYLSLHTSFQLCHFPVFLFSYSGQKWWLAHFWCLQPQYLFTAWYIFRFVHCHNMYIHCGTLELRCQFRWNIWSQSDGTGMRPLFHWTGPEVIYSGPEGAQKNDSVMQLQFNYTEEGKAIFCLSLFSENVDDLFWVNFQSSSVKQTTSVGPHRIFMLVY